MELRGTTVLLIQAFSTGATLSVSGAEVGVSLIGAHASPELISIRAGDTVRWVEESTFDSQQVRSFTGEFTSPLLDRPGASFSYQFNQPGSIAYEHISGAQRGYGGIIYVSPRTNSSSVSIVTPLNGSYYAFSAALGETFPVAFLAVSEASTDRVERVEFYAGSVLLGAANNAPYWFQWTNAPLGTNIVTATQVNSDGSNEVSAPVSVIIEASEAPHLRNPRILRGGVFAFDYTIAPPGGRYYTWSTYTLPLFTEQLQFLNDDLGFSTVLNQIGTNSFEVFTIKLRH